MKKKILTILVALTVIVSLCALSACGEDSSATTESAYEIAVDNGFEGTETEWLESLKGVDGSNGANGEDGTDGTDGADGTDSTITVEALYEAAKTAGYTGTMLDFIDDYMDITVASDNKTIVAQNLLSSVSIVCTYEKTTYNLVGNPFIGYTYDYANPQTSTYYAAGSGVIYSVNQNAGSAYIITNYHVVYDSDCNTDNHIAKTISLYFYGSETSAQAVTATYVGGSMTYDIAVLYIDNCEDVKDGSVTAVTFADSNEVVVGQTAMAIGNAEGEGISVTEGVVSVDSETIQMTAADDETTLNFRVMRIDTSVNPGNSGGGLFDSEGNLIGIVNAKTEDDDVENIGYALPSNVVKYVVENILDYKDTESGGVVKKCMLGISIQTTESKAVYDTETGTVHIDETVSIVDITDTSLVKDSLMKNDVLKTVGIDRGGDGTVDETYSVTRSFIIVDLMLTMRVGDKLTITVERTTEASGETPEKTETLSYTFTMTDSCITVVS
jgi:serine protease Do